MTSPKASSDISSEILPETSSHTASDLNAWHSPIESTDDRAVNLYTVIPSESTLISHPSLQTSQFQDYSENPGHASFTTLPSELLIKIFQILDGRPEHLFNLTRVCHRFASILCSSIPIIEKLWETARIRYWPRNFSIELPRDCESEHQFCRTMLAVKCFFCQSEENPPFILACQMCQITHARVLNPYYGIDDNSSED